MLPETKRASRSPLSAARTSTALACGALALTACAALNVQTYAGASRPAGQVAKLQALKAQILSVDDTPIKQQCGGRLMKDCYVFLLPGLHSMKVQPLSLEGSEGPGYIAPTVATPGMYIGSSSYYLPIGDPVTVRYAVQAGHSYALMTGGTCVITPPGTPPGPLTLPTDKGLCLFDATANDVVHSQ